MDSIKRGNLLSSMFIFCIVVFVVGVCEISNASEPPKAFLDAPAVLKNWESNYGGIKSMQVSYTKRVLNFKLPDPNPLKISAPTMLIHLERIEEGKRYHTRYSHAEDGFARPENIVENAFDGSTSRVYWGREKVGTIQSGLRNWAVETMNAVKQYMLLDLKPVSGELAEEFPDGIPMFSLLLRGGIATSTATVRPNLEPVAGQLCHVVEIIYKSEGLNTQYKFWVAHEKGMLPLKYQRYQDDRLVEEIEVEQTAMAETDSGGTWYPVKAYRTLDHELLGRVKSEITTPAFVPNVKVDENTFRIHFPNGTHVVDRALGLEYVVGVE